MTATPDPKGTTMEPTSSPAGADLAQAIRQQRGSRRRRWPWILAAVAVLALAAGAYFGRGRSDAAAASYRTAALERGDLTLDVVATGNLEPTNQVTVGSELSGTVLELLADANDHVRKGQVLARLDTSTLGNELKALRAALESSSARVLQSEATAREAAAELARQRQLAEVSGGRLPSAAVLQGAEASAARADADLASARASEAQARAQVEIKESNLDKAEIRSPTDGVVLSRSVEVGQTVAASFSAPELFVIAEDLRRMKLEVAVAEADIARLADGQTASFTVDAWPERRYEARVTRVALGHSIVDNVVTYVVELAVDNGDLSLRPGMTATASVRVAERSQVLLVPPAALRFEPTALSVVEPDAAKSSFVDSLVPRPPGRNRSRGSASGKTEVAASSAARRSTGGGGRIWVLRDSRPVPVAVSVGLSDGSRTQVEGEGLQEGDSIVVGQSRAAS